MYTDFAVLNYTHCQVSHHHALKGQLHVVGSQLGSCRRNVIRKLEFYDILSHWSFGGRLNGLTVSTIVSPDE